MNKIFRKATALILVLSLVFTGCISLLAGAYDEDFDPETGTDLPTVYVKGIGAEIYIPDSGEPDGCRKVYPISVDEDEITQLVRDNSDVFLHAVATQEWDEFCDLLCETVISYYEEVKFDKNGEKTDDSFIDYTYPTPEDKTSDGKYPINSFSYEYDFRLSPLEIADDLRDYIVKVKNATGSDKINLVGRCLGSNIIAAYTAEYGYDDISKVMHSSSAMLSVTPCTKAFCGELYIDADGVERYLYDMDFSSINELAGVEDLDQLLMLMITLFNDIGGLDLAAWSVNNVYPDIYLKIVPRIIRETFGTWPGMWSMVSLEDYEKAKDTVFYGADREEYAGLIEKIDAYHDRVQVPFYDKCREMAENGVEVDILAKYGRQTVPITRNADAISDGKVYLSEASFGATTSKLDKRLSPIYRFSAYRNDTYKYISPDCQVDASTCLFPDNTWIIKGMIHEQFPAELHEMMASILNQEDVTVWNSEYPQYNVLNKETSEIEPMTKYNYDTSPEWHTGFFEAIIKAAYKCIHIAVQLIKLRMQSQPVTDPGT